MPIGQAANLTRPAKRVALLGVVLLVGALGLSASPGVAGPGAVAARPDRPTIAQVKATIASLDRQAEIVSESLNTVRVQMADAQRHLAALQLDVNRQRASVATLRSQVIGTTLADYQSSSGLSTAASFLVAKSPSVFMRRLADDAVAQQQQADVLTRLTQQQSQLSVQEKQAQVELDAVRADRAKIADHKSQLATKTSQAQAQLDSLRAAQRARLLAQQRRQQRQALQQPMNAPTSTDASRGSTRPPAGNVPTSARAQIAVDTALAQIGKPYVYGAAGPDAFDCSGLTMYAWAAAGVSIPHSAALQASSGTPVSISDLRPGDLVFYYSPISHVAMYIGHGQVVHAPHTGSYVQIVPLESMPIAMAVRIG